jgi:stage IV sporulation protein FB
MRRLRLRTGKIAGVNIILNNWFLVLLILFLLGGMIEKVLLVFSAVLLHELAHIFTAAALGYKIKEVEILPFGAVARIEKLSQAPCAKEIMIAAAGPLASFGLAVLSYSGKQEFYYEVNLMLAIFNLLPALPLDGGRILRAALALRKGYERATKEVILVGKAVIITLLGFSLYQYFKTSSINLTALFAAVFLAISAKKEINLASFRAMLQISGKKAELAAKKIMLTTYFTALHISTLGEIVRLFRPEEYNMVHVLDENFKVNATFSETQILEALAEKGMQGKIGDL